MKIFFRYRLMTNDRLVVSVYDDAYRYHCGSGEEVKT